MSLKTQPFPITRDGVDLLMILEVFREDGRNVCGIWKIRGTVNLRPKAFIAAVKDEMTNIERIVKEAGCEEIRLRGRRWSMMKMLGYEPFPEIENGQRKVL